MTQTAQPKHSKAKTQANEAMHPKVLSEDAFANPGLVAHAYYSDETTLILNMSVERALAVLKQYGILVNCVVTSPPFYGQRDYGVEGQIGLEEHPNLYIETLARAFSQCGEVLQDNGSLWINIGDTYWSGKGQHKSNEKKQSARRFGLRPQDKKGDGKLCVPKQLLLVPHRLAIALQNDGWIVRNDNVWKKLNPVPDQVRDRCSISHEYVFHLVKQRWYFFNKNAVGRETESGTVLPPYDTWDVPTVRGSRNGHAARFSQELVRIPILSTTPPRGIVLDPFAGTGTSLVFARKHGLRSIGVDIKAEYCQIMADAVIEASQEEGESDDKAE